MLLPHPLPWGREMPVDESSKKPWPELFWACSLCTGTAPLATGAQGQSVRQVNILPASHNSLRSDWRLPDTDFQPLNKSVLGGVSRNQ